MSKQTSNERQNPSINTEKSEGYCKKDSLMETAYNQENEIVFHFGRREYEHKEMDKKAYKQVSLFDFSHTPESLTLQ